MLKSVQPVATRLERKYERIAASVFAQGVDLSTYTQEQLDEIAWSLNTRPRKSLGFRTPVAVYNELLLNMELAKSATKH